ncbi:MAG: hypothetical protein H0W62_13475 [Chitinophagales bacterium]|nr:hypothetical protein [Chitinophagales bacterium]
MKLEKLDAKKFQTLENTQLPKVVGGTKTKGKTRLLGIIIIDTTRDH